VAVQHSIGGGMVSFISVIHPKRIILSYSIEPNSNIFNFILLKGSTENNSNKHMN